MTRTTAEELDARSPLTSRRRLFDLPEGLVYLDGNSLGALPRAVPARVASVVQQEWGGGLIGSWNSAGWMDLPRRVGDRIAPLIGAPAGSVWVSDSTSVSLFKTMVAACRLRPDRTRVVVERSTFPTDAYVAASVARMLDLDLRVVDATELTNGHEALDGQTAVVCLTHVDFRTGAMFGLPEVTARVHAAGAVMLWDLCHTVGAVPVDLAAADVDLAVGCSYKYLNAGPGSPAFMYAAPRLHDRLDQPLSGWMGHARPFDMTLDYLPADGVARLATGTPPVIALSALDAALDVFDGVDPAALRETSLSLTDYFIAEVERRLPDTVEVLTPREHGRRGSQVSLRHPEAYGIVQGLIARGVVGDFREPDVARFGFAPLYVTHTDVHDAVDHLVAVLEGGEHRRPEYAVRHAVT